MITHDEAQQIIDAYYETDMGGMKEFYREHTTGETVEPRRDLIDKWVTLGQSNMWIRYAADPPFNKESFHFCQNADELALWFGHGNWCLGSAFALGNLAFINQVNGGDEWLVIKETTAFESASCGYMLKTGSLEDFINRIQNATIEQCKALDY